MFIIQFKKKLVKTAN